MKQRVWDVSGTLPKKADDRERTYTRNVTFCVIAETAARALVVVLLQHDDATVHAVHSRGEREVLFDKGDE